MGQVYLVPMLQRRHAHPNGPASRGLHHAEAVAHGVSPQTWIQ